MHNFSLYSSSFAQKIQAVEKIALKNTKFRSRHFKD